MGLWEGVQLVLISLSLELGAQGSRTQLSGEGVTPATASLILHMLEKVASCNQPLLLG